VNLHPLDARSSLAQLRVADLHRDAARRWLVGELTAGQPATLAHLVGPAYRRAATGAASLAARFAHRPAFMGSARPQPCC